MLSQESLKVRERNERGIRRDKVEGRSETKWSMRGTQPLIDGFEDGGRGQWVSRSWEWLPTASTVKEMGTSDLQPHGTKSIKNLAGSHVMNLDCTHCYI